MSPVVAPSWVADTTERPVVSVPDLARRLGRGTPVGRPLVPGPRGTSSSSRVNALAERRTVEGSQLAGLRATPEEGCRPDSRLPLNQSRLLVPADRPIQPCFERAMVSAACVASRTRNVGSDQVPAGERADRPGGRVRRDREGTRVGRRRVRDRRAAGTPRHHAGQVAVAGDGTFVDLDEVDPMHFRRATTWARRAPRTLHRTRCCGTSRKRTGPGSWTL